VFDGRQEQTPLQRRGEEVPDLPVSTPPLRPWIDGVPADAEGPEIACIDPSTGEAFAHVRCAGPEDVDRAVRAATFAAPLWRSTPAAERRARLLALVDRIRAEAEEIASLVALEQGKPLVEALALEVLPALDHVRYLAEEATRLQLGETIEPRHPFWAHKDAHWLYDPLGVVALVTSSSIPFAQPLIQTAAALAMGNTVVLKPSEHTPLCGLKIGEFCAAAGVPRGVCNVLPALPDETLRLVAHPHVAKVFVTGTLEAGRHVMVTAGCAPRPVVLSLGGKHPAIVASDADLDRAARGIAWGALAGAGQHCGSVERVFVVEEAAAPFLDRLVAEVESLRMGPPGEQDTELGPLLHEARRAAVHAQVTDAIARGARVLTGGELPVGPGYYYPPTVLLGPPSEAAVLRDETLGPVIPVVVVESVERAILLANEAEPALTASGWTRSPETAARMQIGLQAGVVTINDVLYSYDEPAATWSGFRTSGIGQVHGRAGLQEMSRRKFVSSDGQHLEAPLFAFPYGEKGRAVARGAIEALHSPSFARRASAMARLLRIDRFRARVPWRSLTLGRRRGG
jgi:succinate-semialdehyde dehydrogenase/glutarate-semialdehyde dehydrogenase